MNTTLLILALLGLYFVWKAWSDNGLVNDE